MFFTHWLFGPLASATAKDKPIGCLAHWRVALVSFLWGAEKSNAKILGAHQILAKWPGLARRLLPLEHHLPQEEQEHESHEPHSDQADAAEGGVARAISPQRALWKKS